MDAKSHYKYGYLYECPKCMNHDVNPITNDGGSIQYCQPCNLTYSATKNMKNMSCQLK